MLSRNIEDYTDIGLNAEWCVSTYPIDDKLIFDNEDDTFSLCDYITNSPDTESDTPIMYTGTFSECVEYYESYKYWKM